MEIYKIHTYKHSDHSEGLKFILNWLESNLAGLYDYTDDNQELAVVTPISLNSKQLYNSNWECIGYLYLVDYV